MTDGAAVAHQTVCTNSGSLAWTNSFTRTTKHYPGRLVFLAFNLLVALVLMEADMCSAS